MFFFLMIRRPPRSTRTDTLFPYTTLFRSALQRLKEAAEKAKIELSSAQTTEVNLPFITADQNGPKHLVKAITRSDLERLVGELIKRTLEPCKKALADAGHKAADIDDVVLVGGMTRMPRVREVVKEFFGKEPHRSEEHTSELQSLMRNS